MFINTLIAESGMLRWLTGDNPDAAGELKMHWTNLPESWGWFVFVAALVAIAFAVFWMYRREISTCPMYIKLIMGGLRLTVLALLILMLLKPSVFYQQIDEIKPVVPMLRDASLSFKHVDEYRDQEYVNRLAEASGISAEKISAGELSRNEILDRVLAHDDQAIVEALRDRGSLSIIDFADGVDRVAIIPAIEKKATAGEEEPAEDKEALGGSAEDGDAPGGSAEDGDAAELTAEEAEEKSKSLVRTTVPALVVNGLGSDISQALREALNTPRVSAIILICDGQNTTSEDPVDVARLAAEKGIAIYVVGVGDANPPKNLKVQSVRAPEITFLNEQFEITAQIQATSQSDEKPLPPSVELSLYETKIDEKTGKEISTQKLKTKSFNVPKDRKTFKVVFSHTTSAAGSFKYSIDAKPIEDESKTDDNRDISGLVKVNKTYRVLLVSGLPNWDYLQVHRLLSRDKTISLSCWLQSMDESSVQEGDVPIAYLPRDIEELRKYHAIIMIDPNPEEFGDDWIKNLKLFCDNNAGGLLYMAGPHFTSEFVTMQRLKEFRDVLPVRFGDLNSIGMSQDLTQAKGENAGKMLVVPSELEHPVMSFSADRNESATIWSQLPNVLWNFPTIAGKPASRVLVERGDALNKEGNQPLMVAGQYGAGNILYMGFQGTWRWRSVGLQAEYFDDFWILAVRHLVNNRSKRSGVQGFIESESDQYELGKKIPLYVEARDSRLRGLTEKTLTAVIIDDTGRERRVELYRDPGQDTPETNNGRYSGNFVATRLGTFEVGVESPGNAKKLADPISISIVPPSLETNRTWLNEKKLRNIATQSGGKYYTLDQMDQLPKSLPSTVTRAEFNSPSEPIWDFSQIVRYLAFLLPVILLAAEWTLRKWNKLL